MNRQRLIQMLALFALLVGSLNLPVSAQRLIDFATTRVARLELKWMDFDVSRGDNDPNFHFMAGRVTRVPFRLDLSPYLGRRAHILLVTPLGQGLTSDRALQVRWQANEHISDGQAYAGDRTVVFRGRVDLASLEFFVDFDLKVDSRLFDGRLVFEPYFEISLDTQ